jgi:hypothetical protein
MATKAAKEKAYKAGYALPTVQWPAEATDEQRTPGVHHCPFDARDPDQAEERAAWLEGLKDALSVPVKDPATILKEIDDELGGGS